MTIITIIKMTIIGMVHTFIGVVAQWCNPLTLQPEQSGGVGSKSGRAPPPVERHDKGHGLD